MGLTARLAAAAGISTRCVGSLELVAANDVDAFLLAAKNEGVAILGIEGFRLEGGHPVPDVDAIADFSGLPVDEDLVYTTHEEAHRFLREVSNADMYFDFEAQTVAKPSA